MQPTQILISPGLNGQATPVDVLSTAGTFLFVTDVAGIDQGGVIFWASHPGFSFSLAFHDQSLFFERNGIGVEISLTALVDPQQKVMVTAMWTSSHLSLRCNATGFSREQSASTPPTAPPPRLVEWARRNNLIPTQVFDSEEHFRQRVHSCLQSVSAKIHSTKAHPSLWNVTYEGNRIVDKTPKKETEIQPFVHCLLSDQMLLSGIEVIPEYQTGAGDVDFVFAAHIKDVGIRKFCAEFKLAHSQHLAEGLWHQLPKYMRTTGATYGAYCVVCFGSEWISPVVEASGNELDLFLTLVPPEVAQPEHDRIRSFVIDVEKRPTASKQG